MCIYLPLRSLPRDLLYSSRKKPHKSDFSTLCSNEDKNPPLKLLFVSHKIRGKWEKRRKERRFAKILGLGVRSGSPTHTHIHEGVK